MASFIPPLLDAVKLASLQAVKAISWKVVAMGIWVEYDSSSHNTIDKR